MAGEWLKSTMRELSTLFCVLYLPQLVQADERVVLHNGSPVLGKVIQSQLEKPLVEFWGIPFAEPPTGKLRFKKPVAKAKWTDDLHANKQPNACIQTPDLYFGNFTGSTEWNANTRMSEDCLYLNVWVPGSVIDPTKKLTVMVWIFGGGFWSGCSTLPVYNGKILSTEQNVIVVSLNYRVSVFGFLYLDDEKAPGNMGLWDQNLAMQWVKKNIAKFGGDPDNICIFGESAGGASVTMQVVSPHGKGLFNRAITQSGSVTAPWALEPKEVLRYRAFVMGANSLLGCDRKGAGSPRNRSEWDLDALHDCLMAAEPMALRDSEWAVSGEYLDFPWTPTVDGDFFVEHPLDTLKRGTFDKTQLMVGSNREESIFFIVYQLQSLFNKSKFFEQSDFVMNDSQWRDGAVKLLPRKFANNAFLRNAILFEYKDWHVPSTPYARQMSFDKLTGDYNFLCNVNEFGQYYAQHGGDVYYYYFTHRASQQTWPEWMGVLHGYEINFIFGEPLDPKFPYTNEEKKLARDFMSYWSNFARTGNPMKKPDGEYEGTWPRYNKESQQYYELNVGAELGTIGTGPRHRQCAFWKEYIPTLQSATSNLNDAMVQWRQQFDQWQNEYMVDWKLHFEQYKKYQSYRRQDSCGAG